MTRGPSTGPVGRTERALTYGGVVAMLPPRASCARLADQRAAIRVRGVVVGAGWPATGISEHDRGEDEMRKIRTGFIGVGGIAQAHLRSLQDQESIEVVAVADISRERAEQ